MIAPVPAPTSAPMPVPFSRVLSGSPEHPASATSIAQATTPATNFLLNEYIYDFPPALPVISFKLRLSLHIKAEPVVVGRSHASAARQSSYPLRLPTPVPGCRSY